MTVRSKLSFIKKYRKFFSIKRNHLQKKILVGTHHKTGTTWFRKIFEDLALHSGFKFHNGEQKDIPGEFDVFFQNHSRFDTQKITQDYRGVHIIRDPRDAIISGCFYHQKSGEPWLHVKQDKFGGLTYQEKINSYKTLDDQIVFEMENAAAENIRDMIAWDYDDPQFYEVKYEDLMSDETLLLFHKIFIFLELPPGLLPKALEISFKNSLFSGIPKDKKHIRSGIAKQWTKYFNEHHKRRFIELFDDALFKLKYENDDAWAQ